MTLRLIVASLLLVGGLPAQDVTMGHISFEVASVKPSANAGPRVPMRFAVSPGGQLTVANMPVHWLIANAWNVPFQSARLIGGPEWVRSEPYDIQAVAPNVFAPGISARDREARTRVMLQALLNDRFGLVMRREEKEIPAYVIVPAKKGPKLKPAPVTEEGCPAQPPDDGLYCHHFTGGMGRGLHGPAVDMNDLALYVENWTDRPVVNESGITGLFAIETQGWAPVTPLAAPAEPRPAGAENIYDPDRATIFTVFEEQLGLRLEPRKTKVETWVIERIQRPTAN